MFLSALVLAVFAMGLGGSSAVASAVGRRASAVAGSCATDLHAGGRAWRHQTRCHVAIAGLGVRDIDTPGPYAPGTRIPVLVLLGQVLDRRLAHAQVWLLLPVPLLLALLGRRGWPKRG